MLPDKREIKLRATTVPPYYYFFQPKEILIEFPEFNVLSQHCWCVCNLSTLVRRLLWPYYPSVSLWAVWPVRPNSACRQQPCSWEGGGAFSWETSPGINIASIYQQNRYTTLKRPLQEPKKWCLRFVSHIWSFSIPGLSVQDVKQVWNLSLLY